MDVPLGVRATPLRMHGDARGCVTEIFRDEWNVGVVPCQWNVTMSERNVLRGVHAHYKHQDYLVLLRGKISIGLYDARPRSPTYRMPAVINLHGDSLTAINVPIGVLHGIFCHEPSVYVYGVDSYYDPNDELACHWADPDLKIDWPCREPLLSERDVQAGTLAELEVRLCALNAEFI